jgi:hypothetical protein
VPQAPCVDDERTALAADDEVPDGFQVSPAELLATLEGEWVGGAADGRVWSTLALGEGPIEVVTSRAGPSSNAGASSGDLCGARYEIPVVQTLRSERDGEITVATGIWSVADLGGSSLVTRAPLIEVTGLAPSELVPSEWDTVDLELVTVSTGSNTLACTVQWSALRETDPATAAVATGTASTSADVLVSGAQELVWSLEFSRTP